MQIVIDIPQKVYDKALSGDGTGAIWAGYVKNGTPLPKRHGRLIDADALIKQLEAMANNRWNMQVGASKGLEAAIDTVDDAPTIIEADKGEEK